MTDGKFSPVLKEDRDRLAERGFKIILKPWPEADTVKYQVECPDGANVVFSESEVLELSWGESVEKIIERRKSK